MIDIRTDIRNINSQQWFDFVQTHPDGNVFQTPMMYDLYKITNCNTPYVLIAVEEENIVGVLLSVVITNGNRLLRGFTSRSIIIGGPLVKNNNKQIVKILLDQYVGLIKNKAIYSEIRPIYDMSCYKNEFISMQFLYEGHYNLLLLLKNKSVDELYNNMHKERRRNVKQAEQYGLIFKEVDDNKSIKAITKIIEKTYQRKSVPMSYSDVFINVKLILKEHVRFFAAYYNNTVIAGQVRLCYKDLVYAWFAGSDENYFKLRPNDFLMWNVIRWSKENGYNLFDFGGGGKPGVEYGVRDYKLKYGCEKYEYGRYINVHKPFLMKIGKLGLHIIRKFKIAI